MATYKTKHTYRSKLSVRDTQRAIKQVKDTFEARLADALSLDRVTAPVIVEAGRGINDDLNGVERKVAFTCKNLGMEVEVVQSLAKWKRMQLGAFGYLPGEGIYTDMNALRRDDDADNLHSVFVDQWDWERVITREERNRDTLEGIARTVIGILADVKDMIRAEYPVLTGKVTREVFCITAEELRAMYPSMTAKERENAITEKYGSVLIEGIGKPLGDGKPHDGRAPDYDDWDMNGDILVWNEVLGCALELSSMGVRVDAESLGRQLAAAGASERKNLEYHRGVLENRYPLTVGGGIGQSRLCMFLLEKAHIGEVQSSVWPASMREQLAKDNIFLL